MKLLCIEANSDGLLDLAVRGKEHGHEVRYFTGDYDPVKHPVGKGMVDVRNDWRGSMRWADLVVVGGNGKWMQEIDAWRRQGVPIIGGCQEVARLELDRMAGMAAFRRAGIGLPPYRQCSNLREAIEYVRQRGEGCAVKQCGDVVDKSTSCVGKSVEEIEWRLRRWLKAGKHFPQGLMVQDLVEGCEFAVGGWIGPGGFAHGFEENFEEKKLFPGGIGPTIGEAGTVMRLVRSSKLADQVLKPFEDYLVHSGYCGNIDVNCIVDEDGAPWPLEFTCRLGWPATNIELALHDDDPVEFLAGVCEGDPPNSRMMNQVAVGVVLMIPPYPFGHDKPEETVGVPIWGTGKVEDRLHYCMTMRDGDQIQTAGSYVLVATGVADSISGARRIANNTLGELTLPVGAYWRIDIGERIRKRLDSLQEHGFARGLQYA